MDGISIDPDYDICARIAGIARFVAGEGVAGEDYWRRYWQNFKGAVLDEGAICSIITADRPQGLP